MSDNEIIQDLLQRLHHALAQIELAGLNDESDFESETEVMHTMQCLEAFGLTDREIMDHLRMKDTSDGEID